jgi:hypothetical protein
MVAGVNFKSNSKDFIFLGDRYYSPKGSDSLCSLINVKYFYYHSFTIGSLIHTSSSMLKFFLIQYSIQYFSSNPCDYYLIYITNILCSIMNNILIYSTLLVSLYPPLKGFSQDYLDTYVCKLFSPFAFQGVAIKNSSLAGF